MATRLTVDSLLALRTSFWITRAGMRASSPFPAWLLLIQYMEPFWIAILLLLYFIFLPLAYAENQKASISRRHTQTNADKSVLSESSEYGFP
jgi:purine-cytosine permease-like protein